MKSLLVCSVMCLLSAIVRAADASDPVVSVSGGKIQGRMLAAPGGAVFKGVPFAAPPIGDLRWREPAPVQAWTGVRDTAAFGPDCMQDSRDPDKPAGQEDCLYLNVWTPDLLSTPKKPVMFWIYGGGNNAGSASRDIFDGASLSRKGVVVVSIGYRLGMFGYMAHPGLTAESAHHASGDYGLLDQIAALKWVRDNIASFGGDPDNVTVFGQSAGGGDAAYLLASPLSKGLIHKLIKESGAGAMRDFMPLRQAEQVGEGFGKSLNAPAGVAGIKFLRSLPADRLQKAYRPQDGLPEGKGVVTGAGGRMEPSLDGYLMPVNPRTVFAAGKSPAIPYLLGSNSQEQAGPTPAVLRKAVADFYGVDAPKVLAYYGLDVPGDGRVDPLHGSASLQFQADSQQRCGAVQEAIWHTATKAPVYEYQFSRANPGRSTVAHSSELPYVWGNMAMGNNPGTPAFVETDRKSSADIQAYWTNFAKTGNPNGAGLPNWPRFESAARPYLDFTDNGPVVKTGLRKEICDIYINRMQQQMKALGR
jgi:para-nitrobenzyl esterase